MDLSNLVFPFPFQPYPIQESFMKELYQSIENKVTGIFESPTGTGKSLSICCGALKWLQDNHTKTVENLQNDISALKVETSATSNPDDWLQEEYDKIKKNKLLMELLCKLDQIKKKQESFDDMKTRVSKAKAIPPTSRKHNYFHNTEKQDCETSETDTESSKETAQDVDLLLEEVEGADDLDKADNDEEDKFNEVEWSDFDPKIFISSRTHSQLSQFVGEIKRTAFNKDTRVVTLASRQHFCINPEVLKLKNVNLINERCLDMQKSKPKSTSVAEDGKALKKSKTNSCTSCPYNNQSNITQLKERILVEIMDMEDLVKNGKELKACPYYASRSALDDAQVVLVSHAGVVSSGARSGVSLKLKNNILILDEAHGLTAALEQAHSAPVTEKQLSSVKTYLQFYINKYQTRLSSKNLLSLNQMSFVVGRLLGMIQAKLSLESTEIFTLEDFVIKSGIDHMNLRPLVEFCRSARLAPKLHGFSMRYSQQDLEQRNEKQMLPKKSSLEKFLNTISKNKVTEQEQDASVEEESQRKLKIPTETSAGSGLYALLDFLEMLCDRSENGRVLAQRTKDGNALLKYLLLNPTEHFSDIVNDCRSGLGPPFEVRVLGAYSTTLLQCGLVEFNDCRLEMTTGTDSLTCSPRHGVSDSYVIVAGGTMEPISEFQYLLTGNTAPSDNVTILRCDHVVPTENVLGICLSKGPSNMTLNFSYENRGSKKTLDEVGRLLRNISSIIPGGIVCFVPSYSYEQTLYEHMKVGNVLDYIGKKKKIFREPKSASEVDKVLHNFALAVNNKEQGTNGALMLSVVGGKLSEGLNFCDDLGRCVVVIGMPYPNLKSAELQEKMNYLNCTLGRNGGSVYYENLCMKAVNQCIGRAVRHANDYACVLLVDERYSRPQTVAALPSFVKKSLLTNCSFGPTMGSIAKFFSKHKIKKQDLN